MSPEQERRILEVVAEALERSPQSRLEFLAQNIGNDRTGLAEAQSLLAFRSRSGLLDGTHCTETLRGFSCGVVVGERFRVIRFIGRGGMGDVYEVEDLAPSRRPRVALKTIRPEIALNPRVIQQFEREIEIGKTITHPNVCRIYDLGLHRDSPAKDSPGPRSTTIFLTMELLDGATLSAYLRQKTRLEPAEALIIIRQVADALHAAHTAHIIHRDLKPGNIMLVHGDGNAAVRAVVTDFGLARELADSHGAAQMTEEVGTPDYMSPEQVHGDPLSRASDIYSLGVVGYQMVTGKLPFEGDHSLVRMVKRLHEPPVPPRAHVPSLPECWESGILRCLEREATSRFATALEFVGSLEKQADEPTQGSKREVVPARVSGRWKATEFACLLAVVVMATILFGSSMLDAVLHPLPQKRFVALMAWPVNPSPRLATAVQPVLRGILNAIDNRLARAEVSAKNFLIISSSDVASQAPPQKPADAVAALGANLVLAVSLVSKSSGVSVYLQVLDVPAERVLRKKELFSPSAELTNLAERASIAAAAMLDVKSAKGEVNDQDELTKIKPEAYQLFSAAEDMMGQPNDSGLEAAVERYQKALELDPQFALGYAKLAMAYTRKYHKTRDQASLSLAHKNADLALHYNPDSANAVLSRALVDLYSGNTQEAIDAMRRALQLDPGNPRILLYKARALRDLDRLDEEKDVYRQIIKRRPNFWPAYNELASMLYRHGQLQEAAVTLAEGSAVAPRVALLLTNLGTMYLLLGRTQDARDAFRQSLERAPNETSYLNLGSLEFGRGDYQKAIKHYEKARDLKPKNSLTWRNIADCYAMLGQPTLVKENYAKAAELLSGALQTNPRRGSDWMTLAFYEAKLGHRLDAETALKNAEARGVADLESQFTKAQTLAVMGKREEAFNLVLGCLDKGLSVVEVQLAVDLREIRTDPRYLRYMAQAASKTH